MSAPTREWSSMATCRACQPARRLLRVRPLVTMAGLVEAFEVLDLQVLQLPKAGPLVAMHRYGLRPQTR